MPASVSTFKKQSMPHQPVLFTDEELRLMNQAIEFAIKEDLGNSGDITTLATAHPEKQATGRFVLKEAPCLIAGLSVLKLVFEKLDAEVEIDLIHRDGDFITEIPCDLATVKGPAYAVLAGERLALNLMQRMSGVATATRMYTSLAQETGISILDTRKTAPGLRVFDKVAVRTAGGKNHRFGLFDQILIKDNHVRLAGGVKEAIRRAKQQADGRLVEVETTNLEEVRQALDEGADTILLDNMSPPMVRDAVSLIKGRAQIEVSGGVNLSTIRDYLIPGVTAISIGALTHSVKAIDISLEVENFS